MLHTTNALSAFAMQLKDIKIRSDIVLGLLMPVSTHFSGTPYD
jgi:hypothetical protein